MRTASSALQAALLAGTPLVTAELYTFTLATGQVYRWAAADRNIVDGGNTYFSAFDPTAHAPAITRGSWNLTATLQVDTLDLDIAAVPAMQVLGQPILAALTLGYFDSARVLVKRWYGLTWADTTLGSIIIFGPGRVGTVTVLRATAKIPVNSELIVLNTPVPRSLVETACPYTLGDAGCGVNLATFTFPGTILTGSTRFQLLTNLSPAADPGPPASAPTLSANTVAHARLKAVTYYAVVTYITASGETFPSPEASLFVPDDQTLTVHHPPSVSGAVAWNAYVGTSPGSDMLQGITPSTPVTPMNFTTDWVEADDGIVQGVLPPLGASGYYAQGTIFFDPGSSLPGVSAHVSGSSGGTLTLTVAVAPINGDTFTIIPGDDKTTTTCDKKFNNLIRYGGAPYIPMPEALA